MLDNYRTVKQQCKDPPLSEVNNIIVFIPLKPRSNFISDNIPTKTILFFFGYLEVNGTWLITSELANQRIQKVLFICVVYTNTI